MDHRSVFAVSFAVLLLLSTVTMGGAAAAFGQPQDRVTPQEPHPRYQLTAPPTQATDTNQSNDTDELDLPSVTDPRLGPQARLAIANYTLGQLETTSNRDRRALDRASSQLPTALENYELDRATDRRAFHSQGRALHALSRATGGSKDRTLANLSDAISTASNETAQIAIRDANASLRNFADELDRNEERFVERALRNARSGIDRADRAGSLPGNGNGRHSLRRQIHAQANAIGHYRYAYHHAGRAMDRMERAVDPELSLSQGQAFERNDSVIVVLDASVTDVRPYAYDNATVTVSNGSANASAIRFGPSIAGTSSATGSTLVNLGPDAENVTLTVRSTASHDGDRVAEETIEISVENVEVIPDPPAPDEFNAVEVHNDSTGVTVEAGGDGLWEERLRVTNETPSSDQGFRAGPVVRVESQTNVSNATVRIPIDESVPASSYANYSIYTWSGSQNESWHRVNTTFENGTAVAHVEHFSFFTILNDLSWEEAITETVEGGGPAQGEPISFEQARDFSCTDACNVTNSTTLVLGGTPQAQSIVVEQGNESFEVVPMSNGQRIEEFYDYGAAEINSPLPIAESDASSLFFWAGPRGLSLITLHDKPRDGSGAAVDLAFENLPTGQGSWVVRDDPGDFWRGSNTRPEWRWTPDNTDGGAFRGGLANRTLEITPYFNDRATNPRDPPHTLDTWQFLTGQATDPQSISLDMDQPVTIHIPESPTENASDLEGDAGTATWNDTLADSTQNVTLLYQTEQTDLNPRASLTIRDSDGTTVRHELTIGSVGSVQETVDVSTLDGDVEYTIDASGVNTRIQVLPTTRQPDSDGDGIPDVLEEQRWTMPDGSFMSITTGVNNPDTDDDGLLDGEEIHFETVHTGSGIEYEIQASSNPALADSDYDGITDAVEERGWEIQFTDSPEATMNFADALKGESIDTDAAEATLTTRHVASNPVLDDSDGDGLDDGRERELGTNPDSSDTTGDGIRDDEALEADLDPTLFDTSPPEIDEQYAEIWSDGGLDIWNAEVNYRADFGVHDEAGLSNATIYLDGDAARTIHLFGEHDQHSYSNSRGLVDKVDTVWTGSTIIVEATDRHGNSRQLLVERQRSAPAEGAIAASQLPSSVSTMESLGALNGFLTGVSDSGYEVHRFISNPDTYLVTVITSLSNIGQFDEIPAAMERRQEQANPFNESRNQADHLDYEGGWYTGYAAWIGVTVLVPAGELVTIARNSQLVASTISRLGQGSRLVRAGRFVMRTYDGVRAVPGRAIDYGTLRAVRRGSDLSDAASRRILEPAGTAIKQYEITEQIRRLSPSFLESLSPSESSRLGRFLVRYDDDGGRLMADGGEDLRDLIVRSDGLDEDTTRALLRAHARGDLDDAALQRTGTYLKQGRMDQADVRRMEEMLRTRGSDPLIVDDLSSTDLLTIVRRNSNLEETQIVLRDSNGRLRWLETGDSEAGWQHILERHEGQFLDIEGISSRENIRRHIYRTIDEGRSRPDPAGGKGYVIELENGRQMNVIVGDNGFIVTARPGTPSWWS